MKKLTLLMLLASSSILVGAQERPTHEIHAAMLYDFIGNVEWPNEGDPGTFLVGIIGDDNVFTTMKQWYDGKAKGSKKYVFKKLAAVDEASECQVVYVGKSRNGDFDYIKSSVSGKSVLTVTDGIGMGEKGSCINFRVVEGKLKFEINEAAVGVANLKVSTQLSSMAILI